MFMRVSCKGGGWKLDRGVWGNGGGGLYSNIVYIVCILDILGE